MTSDPTQDPQPMAADPNGDAAIEKNRRGRVLTIKSVGFGLLGAATLSALAGYNFDYLKQASLTSNHFPVFAFGTLFLLAAVWNPIMKRVARPLMMSTGELVIFIAMTMAASWVAGSGLNRYFFRQMVLPWLKNKPQWEQYEILEHLPRHMFPLRADPAYVYIEGIGEYQRYQKNEQGEVIEESDRIDEQGYVYEIGGERIQTDNRLMKITLAVARPLEGAFDEEAAFSQAVERYSGSGTMRDPTLAADADRIEAVRRQLRDLRSQGADIAEQKQLADQLKPQVEEVTRAYYDLPGVGVRPASTVDYKGVLATVDGHGEMVIPQIHTYEIVFNDFANGKSDLVQIPWRVWIGVMATWGPVLLVFAIMIIASAMIVHRQWSRNEQLSYPLAQVGGAMLHRDDGESALPRLFRSRLFWAGAAMVLSIQSLRFFHVWFPENVPDVRLNVGLNFLWDMIPHGREAGLAHIQAFNFYFMLFAIAYFVSSEIGLTLGISQWLLCFVGVNFFTMSGTRLNNSTDVPAMAAGAYIVYGLIILFVGRHYYLGLFGRALGIGRRDDNKVSIDGVFAARVFILAFAALWMILTLYIGVDWLMSLVFILLLLWMFLVFSRIVCETGIPFMQTLWSPALVMTKLLGYSAVGATPMVILYYMSTIFCQDNRECLQPYIANGLKIGDDRGVRPRFIAGVAIIAIIAALVTGFFARVYTDYQGGAMSAGSYSNNTVPKLTGNRSLDGFIRMEETGELATGEDGKILKGENGLPQMNEPTSGLAKMTKLEPDRRSLGWFIFGAAGVAIFFFMRLRFTSFPLHPVLFLVWGTYPMWASAYSFLIGWAVKEGIVRFGGGKVYQDLKPFFIGIIVGELVATLIGVAVGLTYNLITGEIPPKFTTMAG